MKTPTPEPTLTDVVGILGDISTYLQILVRLKCVELEADHKAVIEAFSKAESPES